MGYFTNLILLASFIGLGLGLLLASRKIRLEAFLIPLLIVLLATVGAFSKAVVLNPAGTQEPLWLFPYSGAGRPIPLTLVVLAHFILSALALVPLGQILGRQFAVLPRLSAYTWNLASSLLAVLVFGVLSALRAPPVLWFGLLGLLTALFLSESRKSMLRDFLLSIALAALAGFIGRPGQIWSPYYMVHLDRSRPTQQIISTNNTLHQIMLDLDSREKYVSKTLERFKIPYRMAPSLDDVLIVGSGSGNDVAVARRMGARHIDAVEIDAVFSELGALYHPQKPYGAPEVSLHLADARAYFKTCRKRYDLVVFGTLDSQALLSGLSSVRLDNYVYTLEAFQEAQKLLKPDGIIALFHMSMTDVIAQKIFLLMTAAAGKAPRHFYFSDYSLFNNLFVSGKTVSPTRLEPAVAEKLLKLKLPTDDWPFLYLLGPSIPSHYLQVLAGILALTLAAVFVLKGEKKLDSRFFFLGAGFMLLETKSVTEMSLLFGSTWTVNLMVFSTILAVLCAANLLLLRRGRPLDIKPLFGLLAAVLVLSSFSPISWIAGQPAALKWISAAALVGLPIGLAGLIFPAIFESAEDAEAAMAANLLGAAFGGASEYLSLYLGIHALALVAATFYLAACLAHLRRKI